MTDYLSIAPGGATDELRARFNRAPVWAQNELNRLARDLMDAHNRLADGPEDTDTWADSYNKPSRPLGSLRIIRHHYAEGMEVTITWDEKVRAGSPPLLGIMVSGGCPVVEFGGAVNAAYLRLEPDGHA